MSFKRERTAELLRDFVAMELRRLGDPRLELVTITGCDTSPDLKTAWVYWSVMTVSSESNEPPAVSPKRAEEIEEALTGAAGLFQRKIGKELKLRYTPHLVFRHDHSLDTSARIEYLLKQAGQN